MDRGNFQGGKIFWGGKILVGEKSWHAQSWHAQFPETLCDFKKVGKSVPGHKKCSEEFNSIVVSSKRLRSLLFLHECAPRIQFTR